MPRVKPDPTLSDRFANFAKAVAGWAGHPWAFILAIVSMVVWALFGPRFHYSNAWQLVINSLTNIVTFLMVFVIQNSQNRDSKAINLKLDEVIRSINQAHNELIDIENVSDEELQSLARRYERIRTEYEQRRLRGDRERPAA